MHTLHLSLQRVKTQRTVSLAWSPTASRSPSTTISDNRLIYVLPESTAPIKLSRRRDEFPSWSWVGWHGQCWWACGTIREIIRDPLCSVVSGTHIQGRYYLLLQWKGDHAERIGCMGRYLGSVHDEGVLLEKERNTYSDVVLVLKELGLCERIYYSDPSSSSQPDKQFEIKQIRIGWASGICSIRFRYYDQKNRVATREFMMLAACNEERVVHQLQYSNVGDLMICFLETRRRT